MSSSGGQVKSKNIFIIFLNNFTVSYSPMIKIEIVQRVLMHKTNAKQNGLCLAVLFYVLNSIEAVLWAIEL